MWCRSPGPPPRPPHPAAVVAAVAGTDRMWRTGLRVVGAALLVATAAIHLDLYVTGYRSIPTIGWLFLLQVIAAFVLALAVLVTGSRLAAAAGAGFALSTLGGYLLTVWIGLFGFKEVRTTAGIVAGVIEVAAFAALAIFAATPPPRPRGGAPPPAPPATAGPAAGRDPGSRLGGGRPVGGRPGPAGRGRGRRECAGHGQCRGRAQGRPDRGGERAGQRPRVHPVLVRAGHANQVGLQRLLRGVLAAGERTGDRRSGRHGPARHDQAAGRLDSGDLRRAPAVYLRRRQRSRPGPRQCTQPQRRAVARRPHGRLSPDQESVSYRRSHRPRSRPPGRAWPPRTGRGR